MAQPASAAQTSLVRLIDPVAADQLQLTDEQRSQVEALVDERAKALGAAEENDRAAIEAQFEERLDAVLTDPQRVILQNATARPAAPPEKKLRFTFRFQPWNDVLSWFANEAGLSLVLDAPPPGTFNYTDTREYTISEAIDLLNGVLLTKGHTLIRRDRMLLLVNLAGGIPQDLIPRVTLEARDRRGQFELVQVQFAIGDRDAAEVNAEITPLIGQHGSSVPLPKTKQVLVTETAGRMRAIRAVIESIPEPRREAARPREEPEKPVLQVYPLETVDPSAALATAIALMPEIKVTHDPRLNQLNAFATPTQQAGIQKMLESMRAEQPAKQKKQLQVYPLQGAANRQLTDFLQSLTPGAQLGFDNQSGNLAVFATAAEHELIAESLAQLERDAGAQGGWQVRVFPLTKAQPTDLVTLLATVVPDAKLAANVATSSLVALARENDLQRIGQVVEQLEADEPATDRLQLRLYPLDPRFSSELTTLLTTVTPRANTNYNAETQRLSALARPADHERITSTIEELVSNAPGPGDRQLKFYPVEARLQASLTNILSKLVERADVTYDTKSEHLTVLARPAEHEKIQSLLDQFAVEAPETPAATLQVYELTPELRAKVQAALAVMTDELPNLRSLADADSGNLVVWAEPAQHAKIAEVVAQLGRDIPPTKSPISRPIISPRPSRRR